MPEPNAVRQAGDPVGAAVGTRTSPLPLPLWAIPAGLLLLGIARLPFGYYTFLRLSTCAAAMAIAWLSLRFSPGRLTGWAMVVAGILYNPMFLVHFSREVWMPINIGSAGFFILAGWSDRRRWGLNSNGRIGSI